MKMSTEVLFLELALSVAWELDKGQKEILYPNDEAQPGFPAEVNIEGVYLDDIDIRDNLTDDQLNHLKDQIWEIEHE
jgi:hypothetical protein